MTSSSSTDLDTLAPRLPSLPLELWAIIFGHLSYGERVKFGRISRLHRRLLEEPLLNGLVFRRPMIDVRMTDILGMPQLLKVHPLLRSVKVESGWPDYFLVLASGRSSKTPVFGLPACAEQATSPPVFILDIKIWPDESALPVWARVHKTVFNPCGVTVQDVLKTNQNILSTAIPYCKTPSGHERYDVAIIAVEGATIRIGPEARVSNGRAALYVLPPWGRKLVNPSTDMTSTSSTNLGTLAPLLAPSLPSLSLELWAKILGHLTYGQRVKFGRISRVHRELLGEPLLSGLVFCRPISSIEVTSALNRAKPLDVHPLLGSVNRRSGQPDYFFARGTGRSSERPISALAACKEHATSPPVFSLKVTVWKDNREPPVWALGDQTVFNPRGVTVGDVLEVVEDLLSTKVVSSGSPQRRIRYDVAIVAPQGKTLGFDAETRVSDGTAVLHMRPSIL